MTVTVEQLRAAVKALKAVSLTPRCYDHHPAKTSYGIQCPNCYFTIYDLSHARTVSQ